MIALPNQTRMWAERLLTRWNTIVEDVLQHTLAQDVVKALSGHRDRQLLVGLGGLFGIILILSVF